RILFAVEGNEKLKDGFRKLKQKGYQVLLSNDPAQALKRYQEQPYHALVVDAGSVGKDGVETFNRVLKASDAAKLELVAVLLLSERQADWASDAIVHSRGAVMYLPLNMMALVQKIRQLGAAVEKKG